MTHVLKITGIRTEGRHGASPGEADRAQPFVIDLELEVEATGDSVDRTADYREIVGAVRRVVEGESHSLIETIAGSIADALSAISGVVTCRAVVHKPEAANRLGVGDVSAEAVSGTATPQGTE
jgi:dihydroneopterin aldolase